MNYHPRVVPSFSILSIFRPQNFACVGTVNRTTDFFYVVCLTWRYFRVIAGLVKLIKMYKVSVFPFYPQNSEKAFSSQTRKLLKYLYCQNYWSHSDQILHTDHQILFVNRPKMWPTNPKWRMAAILKKMKNCYISARAVSYTHLTLPTILRV